MRFDARRRAFRFFADDLLVIDPLDAAFRPEQTQIRPARREQPDRHDARPRVDLRLERARIGDLQALHVDDLVAVVGDERRPSFCTRTIGTPPSAVTRRPIAVRAIGTTSIGSGKLPITATRLLASAMHTNTSDTDATIFSRVSAPPPPLIIAPLGVDFIGAVDIHRQRVDFVQVEHLETVDSSRAVLASELETAPR